MRSEHQRKARQRIEEEATFALIHEMECGSFETERLQEEINLLKAQMRILILNATPRSSMMSAEAKALWESIKCT